MSILRNTAIVLTLLGGVAFAHAQTAPAPTNPNEQTTNKAVELTAEQDAAIHREVTMSRAEREEAAIRIGDLVPSAVRLDPLPDSLQIDKVKGYRYLVLHHMSDDGSRHSTVILVDPVTRRVARIIQQ